MRTDDLIQALVADHGKPGALGRAHLLAVFLGLSVSTVGLLATIGLREDFVAALATWRFDMKLAVMAVLLVTAYGDGIRLMRPTARARPQLYAIAIALLLAAVAAELMLTPADIWRQNLIGSNAGLCLAAIPVLSLPPLAAILVAMRDGAPRTPTVAGACAGCLAAAIGALLYGAHCFDDSPLFVATWYPLAMIPVVAMGALIGRHTLRW